MLLGERIEAGVPKESYHLGPYAGPTAMEGAGRRSVAARFAQYAVPFLHELLDRFEQFVEVELRGRAGKAETAPRALARLDESCLSELSEQPAQVVRGSPYPFRDVSRVREGSGREGGEE
jgi:hypothetical protein